VRLRCEPWQIDVVQRFWPDARELFETPRCGPHASARC
jgi:hypothetical protein